MTLLDDPVGWAKSAVGTHTRFATLVVLHLIGAIVSFLGPISGWIKSTNAGWIGAFMAVYSILYLYALRALLIRLKPEQDRDKNQTDRDAA